MPLPRVDDYLRELQKRRRDCLAAIEAAESRGDLKLARNFHREVAQLNSMIAKKGGKLDA